MALTDFSFFHRSSCTFFKSIVPLVGLFVVAPSWANDGERSSYELCLSQKAQTLSAQTTLEELHAACLQSEAESETAVVLDGFEPKTTGALAERIINERKTEFNPFVLTPHRMNYILPVYTTNSINQAAYQSSRADVAEHYENIESKFQLSLKVPLLDERILFPGDAMYFGFTVESWWQVYAENISKPFRETNYRPEFFYITPLPWHPLDGNTGLVVGVEHQSNGGANDISRSWNRVYTTLLLEKNNFALSFQPWWRIPEDEKESIADVSGDDNPDIDEYMGHFEVKAAHKWDAYQVSLMFRRNFNNGNGASQLGFTFPLWDRLRGYAVVFHGYGDSLIDYNHKQTRFGLGFALTDFL